MSFAQVAGTGAARDSCLSWGEVGLDAGGGGVRAGTSKEAPNGGGEGKWTLLGDEEVASGFGDPEQEINGSAKYGVEAVLTGRGGVVGVVGVDPGSFVCSYEHGLGEEASGELRMEVVKFIGNAVGADPSAG